MNRLRSLVIFIVGGRSDYDIVHWLIMYERVSGDRVAIERKGVVEFMIGSGVEHGECGHVGLSVFK